MVGPEHPLLEQLTAEDQKQAVSVPSAFISNAAVTSFVGVRLSVLDLIAYTSALSYLCLLVLPQIIYLWY